MITVVETGKEAVDSALSVALSSSELKLAVHR